jgi:hypothetical protein
MGTCGKQKEGGTLSNCARIGTMVITVVIGIPIGSLPGLADVGPPVEPGQIYVVKKGDTLSQIAKDYLGSAERYRELADLNDLEIETVDGTDHISLRPGQVIKLSLTEEEALWKSWQLIVKRIMKVRGIDLRTAPRDALGLQICITTRGRTEITGHNIHLTLANLDHVKRVLEWYALWDFALAMRSVASERAETPAQVIEYSKILLALAEQESSFRNRPGRDGEHGWWQMKPATAVLLDDSVDLHAAEWLLRNDPVWTANRVLDYLQWGKKKTGSWQGAFESYNGGPNNRHLKEPYAKQVIERLEKLD